MAELYFIDLCFISTLTSMVWDISSYLLDCRNYRHKLKGPMWLRLYLLVSLLLKLPLRTN
jgi:hypothetical protein